MGYKTVWKDWVASERNATNGEVFISLEGPRVQCNDKNYTMNRRTFETMNYDNDFLYIIWYISLINILSPMIKTREAKKKQAVRDE